MYSTQQFSIGAIPFSRQIWRRIKQNERDFQQGAAQRVVLCCTEQNNTNINNIKACNEYKRHIILVPGNKSHLPQCNKGKTKEEIQEKGIKQLHRNLKQREQKKVILYVQPSPISSYYKFLFSLTSYEAVEPEGQDGMNPKFKIVQY